MLMLLPLLPHSAMIMGAFVLSNSDKHALPACSLITCTSSLLAQFYSQGITNEVDSDGHTNIPEICHNQ